MISDYGAHRRAYCVSERLGVIKKARPCFMFWHAMEFWVLD
jgi:hypothetical protein